MLTNYSPDPTLTPDQHHVLSLLAEGHTISHAAAATGVHRNTIRNWRRAVPAFAREIEFAVREQALVWHEESLKLAPHASAILQKVLTTEAASLSLQTRTALTILKIAADPQPRSLRALCTAAAEMEASHGELLSWQRPVHTPEIANDAQSCTIRRAPEPGRNSACPCKSGLKYKRCCGDAAKNGPGPSAGEHSAPLAQTAA